jgi:hypothetical protein
MGLAAAAGTNEDFGTMQAELGAASTAIEINERGRTTNMKNETTKGSFVVCSTGSLLDNHRLQGTNMYPKP